MEPHGHDYFDEYGWTDNLCRKVDYHAPWCYTTDPDIRYEECDCNQIDGKYYLAGISPINTKYELSHEILA